VISVFWLKKKCDQCGKKIEGKAEERYYRTFCSKKHVAEYFGAYIEGEWSDFKSGELLVEQTRLSGKDLRASLSSHLVMCLSALLFCNGQIKLQLRI